MHSKGVPVISILIRNDTQSKIFRIGDTLKDVVEEGNNQTPFTGILRGVQLEARENDANRGNVVYDNIPTIGYWNAGCGMANVSGEDYQVDQLLLEGENGEYRIIDAQHLQSVEIYNEDQDAWINATEAEIADYISSINSDAITTITYGTGNVIDAVINTTDGLDIGLIEFLTGIEGLKSVKYTAGSHSYVMTIGDETSYETFQKGVLASMPNTNGASVNGSVELNAENTASLVYTLNVSYFNQAEEFKKVDNYLDTYAGEDATVVKSADKTYAVTTHVDAVDGLLFDVFPTIAEIKNLSNVKVTIGEQVINNTDVTALKNFVNAALHFEVSWDPVVVAIEITAGEETATYTLTVSSDYDITEVSASILEPCFANVDNDELTLANESADGISWTNVTFKIDPHMLTDSTGFGAALKTVPHVESVTFSIAGQIVTIAGPIDDSKLAQMKDHLISHAPATVDAEQNVVCNINLNFDNVNPSPEKFASYGMFLFSAFDPEASIDGIGYATVVQAFAAAAEGDTVTLNKNITVSNNAVNTTPNNPVLVVPNGVIFDGADHTITADADSWVGNNANHVIGASNVTATIKNLNVVGHANTKSGIVCFGQSGNVTLENVDVQNCGNCGVQVAGATVSATSLTTSGNAWGGVNVDKGSDDSVPHFTVGDGCTFAEKAEVYTEIVDQNVVTAPSMTKVQGFGATLKGFIYYTTDVAKLECIATIGADKYCETVADAVANAVSGDEIKLLENITVDNTAVSSSVNTPVIIIPDGVTFNGGNFTITADSENWVGEGANHILGIVGTTGAIKDVTIEGNGKDKAGVIVYGLNSNGTLENITSKNNGQLGVLIGGATAVATNVNTEGNPWGGINVDKSSDGSIPNFTFNSGTLAENVEIYTEITDQDVVTASGFEKVQGYGDVLKGFIFYTTDKSLLGSINGDGVVYETLADVVENTPNASVAMTTDLTEAVTVPVGANLTIDGGDHTLNGYIKCEAAGASNTSLTLKDLTLNGGGSHGYAITSQNQTDNDQMECSLTLNNVTITGYTAKAIYGTNIKTLDITEGTISECATGSMNEPNTKGDYAVDLNLIAVQGTVVNIDGTVFTGDLGDKAAIKVTQRGGASDAGASDIPKNVGEASVEKVTIANCDFSGSTTEVDFRIGTDNKTGGDTANTTGAYAAALVGNTEMVVQSAYLENEPTLTVPVDRTASKTDSTDIALDLTPEEQVDEIMADIPGAEETAENTYSIVTTNGSLSDLSFFDEIAVLPGFSSMTVSDGTNEPVTYTGDGIMETFKTQVDALLPKSNDDPAVSLTLTVNFAQ